MTSGAHDYYSLSVMDVNGSTPQPNSGDTPNPYPRRNRRRSGHDEETGADQGPKAQRRAMVDILCNKSDCFSRKRAKAIVAEMITAANLSEGSSLADGIAEYGRGESVSSDWIADPIVTPMTRTQAHEAYAAIARRLYPEDTELHGRIAELDTTE